MAKQKRTTVVIAHRLSTIRNADQIAVVHEGKIVEKDTYERLMDIGEGGAFYQLAKKQEELSQMDANTIRLASEAASSVLTQPTVCSSHLSPPAGPARLSLPIAYLPAIGYLGGPPAEVAVKRAAVKSVAVKTAPGLLAGGACHGDGTRGP